ncbi:hypothetical protein Shyd_56650 [Streptomyces hydrogenans]|uniref:Uncharacterized protein n=1 Tax=Streptomyces hydrogenans TaxID=1873719 RepID=A0ABQ3PGZ9_9ACTN|nr:hypothetical protein Shyd_56650 [Streptomyces hydrogenans]
MTFELIQFHPLLHDDYILTERPEATSAHRWGHIVIHDGPTGDKALCATPGCWHSTVGKQPEGWRCWECERVEKRRARVHRRWGQTASGSSAW